MITNNSRDYEVSVWTLQDSFITVLKPSKTWNKGQIQNPEMEIKNDGTQTFSFSIPMYYEVNGEKIENPNWYTTKNGIILVDMRKIKIIFNKQTEDEEVYEFIITNVKENHVKKELTCDISCEGLAFHELGKKGYKLSLNQETFINEWYDWSISTDPSRGDEPISNINYWCDKIFDNTNWDYEIEMDWSAYLGEGRLSSKIYEDDYITSWTVENNVLTPAGREGLKEKQRLLEVEESNIYNITQTLAELFGVFCRYKYTYDENYHIIKRTVIFYNNFIQENVGAIDLNYGYDSAEITREMDATDTISKMYVKSLADEDTDSGFANIADTSVNRSLEDYILNFDYLYNIGTISQEQYDYLPIYEAKMHEFNSTILPIDTNLNELANQLVTLKSNKTIAQNAMALDRERISATNALLDSLTDGTGILEVTNLRPELCYVIEDTTLPGTGCINLRQKGIKPETLKLYSTYAPGTHTLSDEITNFNKEYDEFGNLNKLSRLAMGGSGALYLTYQYQPQLYYENIKKIWEIRLCKDQDDYINLVAVINAKEQLIENLTLQKSSILTEQEILRKDFENLMGPALREGVWQPEDDYSKYGEKHSDTLPATWDKVFDNNLVSFGMDNVLFEDEQKSYYQLGVNQNLIYYPYVNLTSYLSVIQAHSSDLNDLCFYFRDNLSTNYSYYYYNLGSQCFLKCAKINGNINPILMITGVETLGKEFNTTNFTDFNIGKVTSTINGNTVVTTRTSWINLSNWTIPSSSTSYDLYYPRIKIRTMNFKYGDNELSLLLNGHLLTLYEDYYILSRVDEESTNNFSANYYVTIEPKNIMLYQVTNMVFNYTISNTALLIYLDAIQVLKENSIPRVSYTIVPEIINQNLIKTIYKALNRIVNINDYELKFEHVQGYISELHLDLDFPQNDNITITNYKTKFEDLFSTIVAQTEEMKKNSYMIGITSRAFTPSGQLRGSLVQSVMDRVDLNYAFNNGTLTIDEENGIWGTSDSGVVAFRGGGIFTATDRDSNGDWIWNTGILPSGINASLLTAGQIDTNLINIYAGNDLKFQLKGDGLYAYRSWWNNDNNTTPAATWSNRDDGLDLGQYVVHNDDGLFLIAKAGTIFDGTALSQDIKRVSISWDGLTLRNWNNTRTLYADADTGNLHITGAITATALSIINNGSTQSIDDYIAENVDIGGRNLFIGTQDFSNTNSQWIRLNTGWTVSSNTYNGCKIASKSVYWNCMSQKVTVEAGETYTWSAWMKADSTQQVRFLSYREETTGHCTVDSYPSGIFATIGTEWKRVSFTVKIANGGIAEPGADVQNNGVTWYICGIKFERGNVATDWSLAPEDINSDFESVRTELSAVPGQITAAVDSVKIGGANLYVDTRNYTYLHSSNTPWLYSTNWWMSSLTYNGCKVIGKTSPWQGVRQRIYVEAGKQYTFSAWVKATVATTIRSAVSSTVDDCTVTPAHDSFTFAIGTDWQRVSYTFTVTRAGNAEPTVQAQVDNVTLYICGIKFEEGNKATYWTESDEDLRTETAAELTILDGEIRSKVSQTDFNALGERVSDAESTISQTPEQIELAVNAVKVGGTNLFTGTKDFTDDGQWTRLASWTINRDSNNTYNDCVIAQKSVYWNCMSQKVWVEAGAEYTYSMWIKAASTQTVQWLFYRSETTNHCTVEGATTGTISGIGTTWQRISFTKKVATSGWAEPGIDVQNNGVTWYVCGIKFERGNKATDWCEAQGEVYAGTTVKITKDEFNVSTPKFGVSIMNSSEHFTLDGNGGTMDTLTINKNLRADNVAYRYVGSENVTIGSGGTYPSLTDFANAVNNRVVEKTITATLVDSDDYNENVEFAGITGGGRIIIVGAKNIVGQTRLVNCPIFLRFDNVTFIGRIYMLNVACVKFNSCTFNGNGDGTGSGVQQAFYMDYGCNAYCQTCGFYNAASLIYVDSGSRFESLDAKGGNCVNFLLAYRCSIYMQGTRPSGNRVTYIVLSPNDPANLTIDYGSATPVVNPTTTTTINCKASKTAYDGTHWHESDNRIRQGFYTMAVGNYEQYGCLWFDTSALSGKTILNAWLTLTRISGYGRSSEVNVHLWTTPLTSAGNNNNPTTNAVDYGIIGTIGNGETKKFTIPVGAISASANKGFMLRVDDGALISGRSYSTNYAHFYGYGETTPPVLTVTYR